MRLLPRRREEEDRLHMALVCSKCGFEKLPTAKEQSPTIAIRREKEEEIVIVGEEESKLSTMSKTKVACPNCENMEAYWWMVQTRGADESSTQFFRCTRCGYTWREMA